MCRSPLISSPLLSSANSLLLEGDLLEHWALCREVGIETARQTVLRQHCAQTDDDDRAEMTQRGEKIKRKTDARV